MHSLHAAAVDATPNHRPRESFPLMSAPEEEEPSLPSLLTCVGVQARLGDLLDGELTGAERTLVKLHADVCPLCRRHRSQMRRTLALLRKLGGR